MLYSVIDNSRRKVNIITIVNMNFEEAYEKLNRYQEELKYQKAKLNDHRKLLKDKSTELKSDLRTMTREKRNLDEMERFSFSALFGKISGKYEDTYTLANEKYLNAKKIYDEHEISFERLKQAMDHIHADIDKLKSEHDELKSLIYTTYPEGAILLAKTENRKRSLNEIRKEITEAIDAVEAVIALARDAKKSLSGAKDWSTLDTFFGGGIFTDLAKYNKIDEANQQMERISAATEIMRKELQDIDMSIENKMEMISGGEKFFDIAFDNIFSDWNIREKISINLGKLDEFIEEMVDKSLILRKKLNEIDRELASL